MTRLPHWKLHLDALICSRVRRPFAWGNNDCALFAADAVKAITGTDLSAGLRGHRTALQAARTLRRHGGLRGIASAKLGDPIVVADARHGDLVLIAMSGRDALGVVINDGLVAGPGAGGLHTAPLSDASCAWRVG